MREYDPNDGKDEPIFLDHLVQRRGWSHIVHPHIIFPTKEEAFEDVIHQYIHAIEHIKQDAIFELDQLNRIYQSTLSSRLGVSLEQPTIDAIKVVLDRYPNHRRPLLTCISQHATQSSQTPSN